jgi:hypothetical protein
MSTPSSSITPSQIKKLTHEVSQPNTVHAAVLSYLNRSWSPIPVPYHKKGPTLDGWTTLRVTPDTIATYFGNTSLNIGILLGTPSGGLVDIDLDAPEAVALAPYFLPSTEAIFGRPSKRSSHWLYHVEDEVATVKYLDPASPGNKGMLVELRSTGCQTIFPPSLHPSGEPITWEKRGDPARLQHQTLIRAVERLAAATLLVRRWPGEGTRQTTALALAGGLLRAGWTESVVANFIQAVARAAGDEESAKRAEAAEYTSRRLASSHSATGWPSLINILGQSVVTRVQDWLNFRGAVSNPLPIEAGQAGEESRTTTMTPFATKPPLVAVCLSQVKSRRVRWLWRGRIPLGKVTILDGDPGLGKSAIALDLAARLSRQHYMPDGSSSDLDSPVTTLFLSAEDDLEDTIRPRLEAAGADLDRIHALTGDNLPTIPDDLQRLRQLIEAINAQFIVIDPLMAYLSPNVNSFRDQDVRQALAPLSRLASELMVAPTIIRHLNKANTPHALYRGGGSIGIIGQARSGLLVAPDPQDQSEQRRILAVTKTNISKPPPALAYHTEEAPNGAFRIVWEGPTHHTANSILIAPPSSEARSALAEAQDFLRQMLANGSCPSDKVDSEALKLGISKTTLKRARAELGVKAEKVGFGDDTYWVMSLLSQLPTSQESHEEDQTPEESHIFEDEPLRRLETLPTAATMETKVEEEICEWVA